MLDWMCKRRQLINSVSTRYVPTTQLRYVIQLGVKGKLYEPIQTYKCELQYVLQCNSVNKAYMFLASLL